MPALPTSLLGNALLEPVLLFSAARRAQALSDDARLRMKPWTSAAQARFRVALELRDPASRAAALALLRESALLALCALEVSETSAAPQATSPKAAWERFQALPALPSGAPSVLPQVRAAFGTNDPLTVDTLALDEANEVRSAAELVVRWLLELVEVRTPRELARARWTRSALLVLAVVVVVWGLVGYWLALAALAGAKP